MANHQEHLQIAINVSSIFILGKNCFYLAPIHFHGYKNCNQFEFKYPNNNHIPHHVSIVQDLFNTKKNVMHVVLHFV